MNRSQLRAITSSDCTTWGTPIELFSSLSSEFRFSVDVAASAENTMCTMFIDRYQNGLTTAWHNYVLPGEYAWCNPPYGRQIGQWIAKAIQEQRFGCNTVMLLPARTDTRWFHDMIWDETTNHPRRRIEVRFLRGRLRFRNATSSAPFPSMIVIFKKFRKCDFGEV